MRSDPWSWALTGASVLIVLPLLVNWSLTRAPRSAARLLGGSVTLGVAVFTVLGLLALGEAPILPLVIVLVVGELAAVVGLLLGVRRWLRLRHRDQLWRLAPEAVPTGPARVWVRPRRQDLTPPSGLLGRMDRWLATDGPTPTAGWWHNGGLIVDERGAALVDAAGLRHPLPAETTELVHLNAPRSVLLVDARQSLLARLPTTGFDLGDLREFCAVAGWRYAEVFGYGRTVRDAVDLRSTVVDHAAKR